MGQNTARSLRPYYLSFGLLVLLLLLGAASLLTGFVDIDPGSALVALFSDGTETYAVILREIRLPRTLMGMLAGAALGLSGAALQGLFRNPLADPGIIGISAAAGLGAVVAIHFGIGQTFALAVPLFAMGAAAVSTLILFIVALRDTSALTLILVGIGVSSLAVALTSLVMNFSSNPFALNDMVLWLLGSLANRSYTDIFLTGPFIVIGLLLILSCGSGLRVLSLGEAVAETMGVSMRSLRARVVLGSSLAVGASVAVCGTIGFVGLVAPHIVRPFVGSDPARVLWPSALVGAIIVTLADILVRTIPSGQEIKLGVLTSLVGAPFFLLLVIRTRRSMR
jgi:iron complex transport system permease protein